MVTFIDEIAEGNMLALNASIEAARTHGSGEGCAVVADAIEDLAEETRDSAAEISERIEDSQAQSETTVTDVRTMEERVSESMGFEEKSFLESVFHESTASRVLEKYGVPVTLVP